jgi:hypothetical protein
MISSGGRVCAISEQRQAAMKRSSLWAQTMTLIVTRAQDTRGL